MIKTKKENLSNSARVSLLGHFCRSQAWIKEGWNCDIEETKNQQKKVEKYFEVLNVFRVFLFPMTLFFSPTAAITISCT